MPWQHTFASPTGVTCKSRQANMLPGVFSGCGRAGTTSQQTHTHTRPPPTHTPNAHTNLEKAGLGRDVGSPHTLASHLPVFGRFRGKTIQRPRGAIAWRQRAFGPPESLGESQSREVRRMYPSAKKGSLTIPTPCCTCSRARRRPACIPSCEIHNLECVKPDAMSGVRLVTPGGRGA